MQVGMKSPNPTMKGYFTTSSHVITNLYHLALEVHVVGYNICVPLKDFQLRGR